MNESATPQPSVPQPATSYSFNVHFDGAFIFSLQTEGNSSSPDAKITGVDVYAPDCGHTNSATVNTGTTYMLESYWHCIDPVYDPAYQPVPITLGQVYKNIGANTPWTVGNRPIAPNWDIAFKLPVPPEKWICDFLVSGAPACFSGRDATLIPDTVALEHVISYNHVVSANFHGACFDPGFNPVNGSVDVYLTSEVPYTPTTQHERRAADAMAQLLGLDLLWEHSLGTVTATSSAFQPRTKTGNCIMAIVSGPIPASS
jgi:hypothetical protein